MQTTFQCHTLILGGTALACGFAFRHPQKCLILERGIHLAPEFTQSLYPTEISRPHIQPGQAICQELERRGIAEKGRIHPLPAADCLADIMARRQAEILLNAEAIDIRQTENKYHVTISGHDGLSSLKANRILDTTPCAWQDQGTDFILNQAICASICGAKHTRSPWTDLKCAQLIHGALPQELILKVMIAPHASWHDARLRLHDIMAQLQKKTPNLSIGGEATCMVYQYRQKKLRLNLQNDVLWIPSAQYPDLITAFEEGYQCNWL